MDAQTKQPQATPAPALTPEAVASALAVLGEVAKGLFINPSPVAEPLPLQPQTGSTPGQILTPPADRIESYAATLGEPIAPALSEVREPLLTSSRLWTLVGTVAGLAAQHPIGLELPPITQVCIAGVAGIYIAARSLKGGR